MVYASDYPTVAAYRAALIKEFNTVGDLHLIRAQYQLERECQLQDTFAALQQYQQSTGVQLIDNQFFGFEGYIPPVGFRTYTVTNSYYTTITNLPTSTAVGSSVTLTVGPATPYTFVNLNVGLKITNLGVVVSELTAVANNSSIATFTFTMPAGIGPLVLETLFTDIPSNQVFTLYAGEELEEDSAILDLVNKPFGVVVLPQAYVIGDYDQTGALTVADLLVGQSRYGTDHRLNAYKHIEVRLNQDYYYPGLPGSSVQVQLIAAGSKALGRLKYSLYLYDYDQSPAGQYVVKDQSTDDSYTFTNLNTGFAGNLFILATVYNAYNSLLLVPMTGGGLLMSSNTNVFEPSDTFTLTWSQPGPEYLSAGAFQVSAPFLPFPITKTFTGTGSFIQQLDVPSNFDQNAYITTSWITQVWANKIFTGYAVGNTSTALTISANKTYYSLSTGEDVSVTISVPPPTTLNAFTVALKIYKGNNSGGILTQTINNPWGGTTTSSFTQVFNTATLNGGTPYNGSYYFELTVLTP